MFKKIVAMATLALPLFVSAQGAWPNQPVKLIIAGSPGSAPDLGARVIAEALAKKFGQPFVADNRQGANGAIAPEAAARAPKDGHTLLFTYASAQVVNQSVYPKIGYDGAKDFAAIAQIGSGGNVLAVSPSLPVKDLKEFIAYVKSKPPGSISYGSWGMGSGGHLSMEAVLQQTGLNMVHVPYKGTIPMITDLISGQIQVAFIATGNAIPMIQAGKVKPLAYSAPARTALLPDVPTMNEQGVKFDLVAWFGLFAPAGTPKPIVDALNAEVNRMVQSPEMREKLKGLGVADWPVKTPDQFAESVQRDIREWGDVVRKGNIKAE